MEIRIDISDDLMAKAQQASKLSTIKEIVEEGLRLIIQMKQQEILHLAGKMSWTGDLEISRLGRNS